MEFRILGPVEVVAAGQTLALPGGKARSLLAILLLEANRVVSTSRLIDELWGEDLPATPLNTLQVHVSQLRKALLPGHARAAREILVTRSPGYMLRLDRAQLDSERFETLVRSARGALGEQEPARAVAMLDEALALWRGPVLADLSGVPFLQPEIARLEEARLGALEERFEAELQLGAHAALVAELEGMVAQYPLRERLRRQLMLADYRSGRQADALLVYQQTRRQLVEELGIEPGPELQELQRRILAQDAGLDLPASARRTAAAAVSPSAATEAPVSPQRELRKTVSILAVEITGAGDRDPEAVRRSLAGAFDAASEIVREHGGTAERTVGDMLLGVLGVPTLHEDDALRALQAAVAISRRTRVLPKPEDPGGVTRIELRIGVNTGQVLVREPSPAALDDLGGGVNEAARLARAAAPGEVLLSESTRRLVPDAVRVEPARAEGMRGSVWKLLELVSGAPPFRRRLEAVLVGRQEELGSLRQAFSRAAGERTAHLATVLGPAGIGKSRLAQELAFLLEGEARVVVGRCLSYGTGTTFWPLAEILRELWPERAPAEIIRLLGGGPEARLVAARLAGALGLDESPSAAEEVASSARKVLEALARRRPLVVVFDDLQWAEPTFLDLIEHLRDWTRDAPILLLCLARPELLEARPSWGVARPNAGSIFLPALSDADVAALIDTIAGERALAEHERERIAEAAEGNPLFIEQMLAMVLGGERLESGPPMPPTLQALLAARLDALGWQERTVLEIASVIGKDFPVAAVAELAPEPVGSKCALHLQLLLDKDLLGAGGLELAGAESMRFRHILIREAAYESVSKARRAELHERVADWLELRLEERRGEYEEILGYHLEQAHDYRREIGDGSARCRDLAARGGRYLLSAGRRAYAISDLPAAVSLFTRASQLLPADDRMRLELLPDLGEALRESGDFRRADEVLLEAVERARDAGERALECQALVARARMQLQVSAEVTTDEVRQEVERAIRVFEEIGDARGLGRAWTVLAWVPWVRCQAAAAETALEQAISHAARAGDERTEAQSLNLFVGAAVFGPLPVREAIRRCEQVQESYAGRRRITASAFRALAVLSAMEGRFDEARAFLARDREILCDLGLTIVLASASEAGALVEMLAGEPGAAERELRQGYETLAQLGERSTLSTLAALRAHAACAQGEYERALEHTQVSERAAPLDDVITNVQWRSARALVLARQGRRRTAERLGREAVELAARTDFLNLRGDSLIDLAEVLRLAGRRRTEALRAVEQAVSRYEQKGNVVSSERARVLRRALLGTPPEAAGEIPAAG